MIVKEEASTIERTPSKLVRKVAVQGYPGAFHEIASRLYFDQDEVEIVPADTFDELVDIIETGEQAKVGLMAIENTIAGSLLYNYKLLYHAQLKVIGETYLRINQNLMVLPGQKLEDLTEVHSHPVAIVQCREFFKPYPHIRLVESTDTALSAKLIRDGNLKNVGAIASKLAAELYEMEIIGKSIETNKKNYTRFVVLEHQTAPQFLENVDKVSVCFAVEHEVGSLHKVLAVLTAYNINLTKIQSSPIIGKQWEYLFFVDFVINGKVGWEQALEAIQPLTTKLKVLGTYQRGVHFEY